MATLASYISNAHSPQAERPFRCDGEICQSDQIHGSGRDDITDSIDHADLTAGDVWNRNGAPMSQSESNTGSPERMSGDGVQPMVGRYSEPTAANEADATAKLGDRMAGLEKAMAGIASCLAIMLKADERFPDDESGEGEEEEEDETAKSEGPASISLADAFSFLGPKLSKRAAAAAKAVEDRAAQAKRVNSLATPPSMIKSAAIVKSAYEQMVERIDNDPSISNAENLDMRIRINAQRLI